MSPAPGKRTVIFDLDGTLADTAQDLLNAANTALSQMGYKISLDVENTLDRAAALQGGRAMLSRGLAQLGDPKDTEIARGYPLLLQAYAADIATHTQFFPGALDAIEVLQQRGHKVGICTNKPEGLARKLLESLGVIDRFHSLIGADTLPVRKPNPEPLRQAILRAGGQVGHACLIGDTITDRDTARAAGAPCILVTFGPNGHSVRDLAPDALLDHFEALPDLVEALDKPV